MAMSIGKTGIRRFSFDGGLKCVLPCGCSVLLRQKRSTIDYPNGDPREHVVTISDRIDRRMNDKIGGKHRLNRFEIAAGHGDSQALLGIQRRDDARIGRRGFIYRPSLRTRGHGRHRRSYRHRYH